MPKCLITGVAGFIGSHLAEKLTAEGFEVIGIDSFSNFYSRALKERNLKSLKNTPRFTLIEGDLVELDLMSILQGVKFIFHEAAQAGVMSSWGKNFDIYLKDNLKATQELLEALKETQVERFIFASSSSVYGNTSQMPLQEESRLSPFSPYGVTKLAAENLALLYWRNYKIPVVGLRYFTIYGPRQRPDMAFHKFIKAALKNEEALIYGDGTQTRDFTFVQDIVEATYRAAEAKTGEIYNIAGGSRISIIEALRLIEKIAATKIKVNYKEKQAGDVAHTFVDTSKAESQLGFKPKIKLEQGLKEEIDWMKSLMQEGLL